MSQHEFTLVLDHTPTDDELDALFEAGLDDSTPEFGPRAVPVLHVHRDADSLATAVVSAVAQAEAAGLEVVGVRTEDLVTLKTIAARTSRTYEAVRRLANTTTESSPPPTIWCEPGGSWAAMPGSSRRWPADQRAP